MFESTTCRRLKDVVVRQVFRLLDVIVLMACSLGFDGNGSEIGIQTSPGSLNVGTAMTSLLDLCLYCHLALIHH